MKLKHDKKNKKNLCAKNDGWFSDRNPSKGNSLSS